MANGHRGWKPVESVGSDGGLLAEQLFEDFPALMIYPTPWKFRCVQNKKQQSQLVWQRAADEVVLGHGDQPQVCMSITKIQRSIDSKEGVRESERTIKYINCSETSSHVRANHHPE